MFLGTDSGESRTDGRTEGRGDGGTGAHLPDLFEGLGVEVGEDVAVGLSEDLEGHGAVVVLQGRDVVVADGELRPGVDLVPDGDTWLTC